MNAITVLTPTYNRASMLPNLREALLAQTKRDFLWLIVDDGSTDETESLVRAWQAEGTLEIRYVKRENGGKHCALNTGIAVGETSPTFIVDSDDLPLPCAMEEIERIYEKYGLQDTLCGYSFTNVTRDGKPVTSKPLERAEETATFADLRMKRYSVGDMSEIWFTEELQKAPFPEFDGEKFYSETGVWLRMSGPKAVVFVDKPILQRDYFADGLTKNRTKQLHNSPRGVLDVSKLLMTKQCGWRFNLRGGLRYCVFAHMLGMGCGAAMKESGRPCLTLLCWLPSLVLRKRWA